MASSSRVESGRTRRLVAWPAARAIPHADFLAVGTSNHVADCGGPRGRVLCGAQPAAGAAGRAGVGRPLRGGGQRQCVAQAHAAGAGRGILAHGIAAQRGARRPAGPGTGRPASARAWRGRERAPGDARRAQVPSRAAAGSPRTGATAAARVDVVRRALARRRRRDARTRSEAASSPWLCEPGRARQRGTDAAGSRRRERLRALRRTTRARGQRCVRVPRIACARGGCGSHS